MANGQHVANTYWLGLCILLFSTFENFPITSWTDTPFHIMKALRSDRMHPEKTIQKEQDSLPEGDHVPSGAGTSPQLTVHVAQCCVQHYTECTALEGLAVQSSFLMKSLNRLVSNNVEATELIQHTAFRWSSDPETSLAHPAAELRLNTNKCSLFFLKLLCSQIHMACFESYHQIYNENISALASNKGLGFTLKPSYTKYVGFLKQFKSQKVFQVCHPGQVHLSYLIHIYVKGLEMLDTSEATIQ